MIIGGIVGGCVFLGIALLAIRFLMQPTATSEPASSPPPTPVVQPTPAIVAEPFREINLPENTRQQIYRDYRTAAGTSVEKPIPLPKEWKSRQALDATLNKMLERELTLHASIHNITVDDVAEILKEGNAKQWK